HARAEVDDRLLLLDRLQRLGERLQRAKPHIVVERVELLRALSITVESSVAAAAASSVDAVLASTAVSAVPSVAANPDTTSRTRSRLLVKSVSTCRLEPMLAIATRSAGDIWWSTHFTASSMDFWTSSGCIEL